MSEREVIALEPLDQILEESPKEGGMLSPL